MNVYQMVLLGEIFLALLVFMIITRTTEWKEMALASKRNSRLYQRIKSSQIQCDDFEEDIAFDKMIITNTDILNIPDK